MNRGPSHAVLRSLLLVCLAGLLLWTASQAHAQSTIAMVSDFSGTVILASGQQMTQVSQPRQPIASQDLLMTRAGTARITFGDGATLDLPSYSLIQIRQGLEAQGKLTAEKEPVRRITLFVGKMSFKSGSSPIRNCLQTPTASATLSGTEANVGFDNVSSYLQLLSGQAQTLGNLVRSTCENPGVSAAEKNELFQQLSAAWTTYQTNPTRGKLMALTALGTAATLLLSSPDPAVAALATETLGAVRAEMVALGQELQVQLAALEEAGESTAALEEEIREVEEAIRELDRQSEAAQEEEAAARGVTTTTTTTTSTTTVSPTSPKQ